MPPPPLEPLPPTESLNVMALLVIVLLDTLTVPPLTKTPPPPADDRLSRIVDWLPVMTSPSKVRVATLSASIPPPPVSLAWPPVIVRPEIVTDVEAGGTMLMSNTEVRLTVALPLIVRFPAPGPEIVRLWVIISDPLVSVIV